MSPAPLILFSLISLTSLTVATHNYDRSDSWGVYYYNSYGQKRYSRCYERYARTANDCRGSSYRNYDYRDNYDRYNRYDRYGDYDRYDDKVNVGRGTFRLFNGGRDAELSCEFPVGSHIISNIVWERADRARSSRYNYNYRDNSLDYLDSRMQVRSIGDYGSVLTIRNFNERTDSGLYNCVATRSYGSNYNYNRGRRESVYMDILVSPRYNSGSGFYSGSGRDYDGYFSNYDRYNYRPYYAYSKTDGDTLVTDNSLAEKDQDQDQDKN